MKSSATLVRPARAALIPQLDRPSFREGVRDMSAPGVAIGIWGLVTGVAMVNRGLSVPLAIIMTFVAFAGSAQLAALPLLAVGAPLPVVWVTALLVNVRFVIFSAASRRFFAKLPWKQRLFASYLNGDVGFALFARRFGDATDAGTPHQWGYFFGGAAVNWVAWQAASVAGILLGGLAPTDWGLELAALLALVAVLIPMVTRFPAAAGVLVTGILSIVTVGMPMRLGLLVSVLAGVSVAVFADATVQRFKLREPEAPGEHV